MLILEKQKGPPDEITAVEQKRTVGCAPRSRSNLVIPEGPPLVIPEWVYRRSIF
jgi:hypothetical protein